MCVCLYKLYIYMHCDIYIYKYVCHPICLNYIVHMYIICIIYARYKYDIQLCACIPQFWIFRPTRQSLHPATKEPFPPCLRVTHQQNE